MLSNHRKREREGGREEEGRRRKVEREEFEGGTEGGKEERKGKRERERDIRIVIAN